MTDTHYAVTATTVYPDDFEYGILYGFAKRWLPKGTVFTVSYSEGEPRRDEGGTRTVYHIEWE